MKQVAKIILGLVFSFLFLVFVLLSALNFQLLNKNYLFSVFEKGGIYHQLPVLLAESLPNDPNIPGEEKEGFANLAKSISPGLLEEIIKENVTLSLDFIWGQTDKIAVLIPAKKLGIGATDVRWSPNPQLAGNLNVVNGIGQKLLLAWYLGLAILTGLFVLYSRLTSSRKFASANMLLIINGTLLLVFSLLVEAVAYVLPRTFPANPEPSQALIKFAFGQILPQILIIWIICGILLLLGGIVLRKVAK